MRAHVIPLRTWFKPMYRFDYDGKSWAGDQRLVVSCEAAPGLKINEHAPSVIAGMVKQCSASTPLEPQNGYRVGGNGLVFRGHFIDLVESVHPGAAWRIDGSQAAGAFFWGRPVAVVMATLERPAAGSCGAPSCPACDGGGVVGEKLCHSCGGSGNWKPSRGRP